MDLMLTIDATLAEDLHALAAAQGISVDEAGRRALMAGLREMASSPNQLAMLDLGSLDTSPVTVEQIKHMRSPIVVCGQIPPMKLTIMNSPLSEQPNDAY